MVEDQHSHQHSETAESAYAATIVFTVHNRRDLLLRAIELAKLQTVPLAIIVADDASVDGTKQAVMAAHADVTYLYSPKSHGPCYQRNRGVEAATTEFVFPLDDDSFLISPQTIAQAIADFADPTVAVVGMPYQNILQSEEILQAGPDGPGTDFFEFVGCAHGVRRAPYLAAGGYFEDYFYMGEENDLALRLHDRGWRTIRGTSDPLHHMQPPLRRSYRPDFYGRRNDVLFYYMRAPGLSVVPRLAGTIVKGMIFAIRTQRLRATLHGFAVAIQAIVTGRVKREPISHKAFRAFLAARQDQGAGSLP